MKSRKRVYIIAEIGINFNRSLNNCLRLIDVARDAGCDCAKFQFFKTELLYPETAGLLDWKDGSKSYRYNIYEVSRKFELPGDWIKKLMSYCRSRKIDFLTSVFDKSGADFVVKEGVKSLKIPSFASTNIPLIEHCARTGLPLILSVGAATLGEVEEAVSVVTRYHNRLSLLHCSIKYPTLIKDSNLGVIDTLRSAFPGLEIGFSDHSFKISEAAVQSVFLGSRIVEKHITLDKKMPGPDHFFALEPDELKKMVNDIRFAEDDYKRGDFRIDRRIYGSTAKVTYPHERYLRDFAFMTLFARRRIHKGMRIKAGDILILRPGNKNHGLEPKYLGMFKENKITASINIPPGEPIKWSSILK